MIDAAYIANGLDGKRSGKGYRCRCPVHGGDSGTSFSVRDGQNGPLVKCFAGCDQTDVIKELRDRGLWPDATPEQKKAYRDRKRIEEKEYAKLVLDIAEADKRVGRALSEEDQAAVDEADNILQIKPEIKIYPGHLHEAVANCQRIISNSKLNIYVQGDRLVRPVHSISKRHTWVDRDSNAVMLSPVTEIQLETQLPKIATLLRFNKRVKDWTETDVPTKLASAILGDSREWTDIPHLRGLVQTPVMQPDGSIIDSGGYDVPSGLFVVLDCEYPRVQDRPTQDDAKSALRFIESMVQTFPFTSDMDRAVWVAAVITAIQRPLYDAAPAFGFSAPVPGSGKTLLAEMIAVIKSGSKASAIAWGDKDEESEKRINACMADGDQVILIDNIERPLRSQTICIMLTQPHMRVRILGQSKQVTVSTASLVLLTGNNLQLRGDVNRRILVATVDPKIERPELRKFDCDPIAVVREKRAEIVQAVLTILKAHHNAGHPSVSPPLGSFEAWSQQVRDAMVWAGSCDPVAVIDRTRLEDPDRESLVELLNAIYRIGARGSAGALIDVAENSPALNEALRGVVERGGRLSTVALGRYLKRHQGRVVGGLMIKGTHDKTINSTVWQCVNAPEREET